MAQPVTDPHYQPIMNRRMVKRGIIGLIIVVVLLGLVMAVQHFKDIDLPAKANTAGFLAALQAKGGGAQAVLIKPDGTIVPSPGYTEGATDRELAWRPDGNRVFFASDRENGQVHLYRWNPASNKVERRTQARAAYSKISFSSDLKDLPLVISNGNIAQFDPTEGITSPVIPPPRKREGNAGEGEGAISSMEAIYGELGNAFRSAARFSPTQIVGVLKGGQGEVLILQDITLNTNGMLPPPAIIAAGERIEMDSNQKTSAVVFVVQGFRFPPGMAVPPEFIKNNKVVYPFRHLVGMLDPKDPSRQITIMQGKDDDTSFSNPVFSPDGSSVALIAGTYAGEGDFSPKILIAAPAREQAASSVALLHKGPVSDVTFSADGSSIAYVERGLGEQRSVHVMNRDGSNDKVLAEGDFRGLRFSPQ